MDWIERFRWDVRRLVIAAITAVLAAEILIVGGLAVARGSAPLAFGLGADALLLGSLALWLAGTRMRATLRLERVLRLGLIACALVLGAGALAGHLHEVLAPTLLIAELCVQGAVVLGVVRAVRTRGAMTERIRAALESVVPQPVARVLLLELQMMTGATCALLRVGPPEVKPVEGTFVPLAASRSGWVIPFFILAAALELPAMHLVLRALWPGHLEVHLALVGSELYGLLWLIGDRFWLSRTAHQVGPEQLRLRLGRRVEADIPLASIQRMVLLPDDGARKRVQPRQGRNPKITPWDPPNVHLCLEAPCVLRGALRTRRDITHLDLFVDRPEAFVQALRSARRA